MKDDYRDYIMNNIPKTEGMMVAIDKNLNSSLNYILNSGNHGTINDMLISNDIEPPVRAYLWVRTGMNLDLAHYLAGETLNCVIDRFLRAIRRDINSIAFDKFLDFIAELDNSGSTPVATALLTNPRFSDTLTVLVIETLRNGDTHKCGKMLDFIQKVGLMDIFYNNSSQFKNALLYATPVEYRHDDELDEFVEIIMKKSEGFEDREFGVSDDQVHLIPIVSLSPAGDMLLRVSYNDKAMHLNMACLLLDYIHDSVLGDMEVHSEMDIYTDESILELSSSVGIVFDSLIKQIESIRGFHRAAYEIADILAILKDSMPGALYGMFKEELVARHLSYITKMNSKYTKEDDGVFDLTEWQAVVIEQDLGNIHDHIHWYLATRDIGGPAYTIDAYADDMFEVLDSITVELSLGSVSRTAMLDEIRGLSDFKFSRSL